MFLAWNYTIEAFFWVIMIGIALVTLTIYFASPRPKTSSKQMDMETLEGTAKNLESKYPWHKPDVKKEVEDEEVIDEEDESDYAPVNQKKKSLRFATILAIGLVLSSAILYSVINTFNEELDSDNDGISDQDEYNNRTNPTDGDSDSDGLSDQIEQIIGTDPLDADTDNDGLSDYQEYNLFNTDPLLTDTDGDDIDDKEEIEIGTNPSNEDTDSDGLDDWAELNSHQTNPTLEDTDEDGLTDLEEVNGISIGWEFCAFEWGEENGTSGEAGYCSFNGTLMVKYGKDESVTYQNHTDGVECSNGIFGNPLPGISKECHYQIIVDTSPTIFDTDGDTFGDGFEIFTETDPLDAESLPKDFSEMNLSNYNLSGADLSYSNFFGTNLYNANLEGADLSYSDLTKADLSRANMAGANLNSITIDAEQRIHNSEYTINLSFAILNGASLTYSSLPHANLFEANMSNTNLSYSNLKFSFLPYANFENANLSYTNLDGAYLPYANFTNGNLYNAKLINSTLAYVDLTNANLSYANMNESFWHYIGLFTLPKGLTNGTNWDNTICPDGVVATDEVRFEGYQCEYRWQ